MDQKYNIKWGIIGAGNIAHKMADALELIPYNKLLAVASKTPSKARIFADTHGIENVLNYQEIVCNREIDIIYVATTHNFHYENARLALEHGKHVLIEKPFTVNAGEARKLVRIAREKNLFLMEAMWTRFLPSVKRLKSIITNQEIGDVKQINISYGVFVGTKYEKRLSDPALAGGVTLDMGIYAISFACYLLGELPASIKSMTNFNSQGADELSNYMFQFSSGCLANICTSYNLKMTNEATVYGTKGYITFPQFPAGRQFTIHIHDGANEIRSSIDVRENNLDNGFIYQVEEVVGCMRDGRLESSIMPLNETVGIMEVMDKMREEWDFIYPFER